MWLKGQPYEPKSVEQARTLGVDVVYQDLALIDELSVYQNMFLCREERRSALPFLDRARMKREHVPRSTRSASIYRGSTCRSRAFGGQRQSIAVARGVYSDADILLLDEPLAAMGAKEGAMILELIARLKAEGKLSMIMILHNYVHVLESCDGEHDHRCVIALDKPTAETSLEELTEIVVDDTAALDSPPGRGGRDAAAGSTATAAE